MRGERLWWELNAYADGELQGAARERLEAALAKDEGLQATLRRIQTVKQGLAQEQAPAARPKLRWHRMAAAAGGLTAVLVLGWAVSPLLSDGPWQAQLAAAHMELAEQTFVVETSRPLPVVSSRRLNDLVVPDLRASRLHFVDARTRQTDDAELLVMHYRGLNGCRLSIAATAPLATPDGVSDWQPGKDLLFAGWRVRDIGVAVIADGMDAERFRAIVAYVKAAIEENTKTKPPLRTAMVESTSSARPCA